MLGVIRRLRNLGVLGINQRNSDYVLALNPRRLFPLVDDKLRTKELAIQAGMAVPELYGVVRTQHDIRRLKDIIGEHKKFVIKPAHGSGGDGILVINGRPGERFRKIDGQIVRIEELNHHISNTLNGQYSLGGAPDCAMIEYCVQFDPVFQAVSYQGVPDVRIIVLRGIPVMAMVRLPTRMSGGKANLHQGAVGAGVDIRTGRTLEGVLGNYTIGEHPDTGNPISGIVIPGWEQMLNLAARCFELTDLGYLGVDIVLDRDLGPLILELNARPGLNIQIANHCGLATRLAEADRYARGASVAERIQFAKERFGVEGIPAAGDSGEVKSGPHSTDIAGAPGML